MSDFPLLFFPIPELSDRTKRKFVRKNIHTPPLSRQGQRLLPKFNQLRSAFNKRRVELLQNTAGVDPELALVLETVGCVDEFANSVKRINGLEWMGEIDTEEIAPDEDFYDSENPQKALNGRLYMVMSNQQALREMLSLWRKYQKNPQMKFARGLTKFRDVFLSLKNIRRWDVQDRLLDTGILECWQEDLKSDGKRNIQFEVELWFRGAKELRIQSQEQVAELICNAGGQILGQSIIEGIAYHAILAELPANAIQSIIDNPTTSLVKCDNVMFFRPAGQMMAGDSLSHEALETLQDTNLPLPTGEPTVALLDGLPLANHCLLANRLIIDDPDKWETDYAATERIHGSSMASLIVHGDLNRAEVPLARPLYVRPIMKPKAWHSSPRPEAIPENCLAIDLIHRAVRRLFEGDVEGEPVAPQIKIINLSIGDYTRQFLHSMSPLARLLDWLSVKYNVLFIVSAGNHSDKISYDISRADFNALTNEDRESLTVKAIYRDARNRKLLSPAETINGITVGSVHFDESQFYNVRNTFNPFERLLPSPVSAFGSGYRRSIKPDLIFYGGRQLYRLSILDEPATISPVSFYSPPGNKVVFPKDSPGELSATAYARGTSNATALLSRAAGICYDRLLQLVDDQLPDEINFSNFASPLLKAMLVHGCSWDDIASRLLSILHTHENGRNSNALVQRWIGYGLPIVNRVLNCSEQRATILGFGELTDGQAHVFSLPLPPSLESRPEWRRLTITLAWLSPISPSTQKYRNAHLWFELLDNPLTMVRNGADWQAVRRGTLQHEIFEGESADPFLDGQHIKIKVNCRKDAGKIQTPIAYGLAVSLEVAEGASIAIYEEIKSRVVPAIPVQQTT